MNGDVQFFFARCIAAIAAVLLSATPLVQQNTARLEQDRAWQIRHVAKLEKYVAAGKVTEIKESAFFEGNLKAALRGGLKFNELRYVATHNSYQNESVPELQKLYGLANRLTFGAVPENDGEFQSAPLWKQLDQGVRSLELDIETMYTGGETSFVCLHSPVLDMTTNCYDLALALQEIRLWSDSHPKHLPITIIIEPKVAMLPLQDMDFFTRKNANALDALLRRVLGKTLLTPADMLRDYANFAEMRANDDWLRVDAMLGSVLVLLHSTPATNAYILQDQSLRSQAMFPMLRTYEHKRPMASFLIENDPEKLKGRRSDLIDSEKCIVRTRADSFGNPDKAQRMAALDSGGQIMSTDYPPLKGEKNPFSFALSGAKKNYLLSALD